MRWVKSMGDDVVLVVLLAAAVGYVAIYGSPTLQAGVAAGLVWLLLFGGLRRRRDPDERQRSDAAALARDTLIPRQIVEGRVRGVRALLPVEGLRAAGPVAHRAPIDP